MSKFVIEGGLPLSGRHYSPGNKNAALPMIAASLLADSPVEITNVPLIRDVRVMLELVSEIGAGVSLNEQERKVVIDPTTASKTSLSEKLCSRIRTSILFAGPLLAKAGGVDLPPPGGDVIGRRRLDTHFEGLRNLGATVDHTRVPYRFRTPAGGLHGTKMILDEASVTATENIVMAAVLAKGRTEIFNAACEPHVQDLCRMLCSMGARISGIGTNLIVIDGVESLHGASIRVSPDSIEAASFIAAAAATHGSIVIDETVEQDFEILKRPFARLGVAWTRDADGVLTFDSSDGELRIASEMSGAIAKIEDGIWPQTPTDLLSVLIVLATQADGIVLFFEKMFESRLYFVDNLINMGAQIVQCDPHRVVVRGVSRLRGSKLLSPDIRAGMALLVAGLCAEGVTTIANAESIDRGYEPVEKALSALGAKIIRLPD
ncbi:MAG: UDP-N-acetylglucosamine 1-carboxyvinyltransferase [Kiritimatiellia bacterium]|jgi:UDP-N-acetylglucosamine 1-carboxyvinyltransferase